MSLDPVLQSLAVGLLAWLLKKGAAYLKIEIDEATLNTIAVGIIAFLLSQLGAPAFHAAVAAIR